MADFAYKKELATIFLKEFINNNNEHKYLNQLQEIANLERYALEIELDDIRSFRDDSQFATSIMLNTKRYTTLFATAAFSLLPAPNKDIANRRSVYDLWVDLRRQAADPALINNDEFREMSTRFEVYFIPFNSIAPYPLRSIRSDSVGKLISVRGIVTKVTDVLPLIAVQAYYCRTCEAETYQQVNNRDYTPLTECQSTRCRNNQVKGDLVRLDRGSKFRSFQEIKIQELPVEVPIGTIPRSMTVRLYGEALVRILKPGDIALISGIYLPSSQSNSFVKRSSSRSGLVTDTYIEASQIKLAKKNYGLISLQDKELMELHKLSRIPDILDKLATSICPEIFGHHNIKKALLLSMIGGVTKTMPDGMRIRGDINLLLVGDPGMAKSQLLKHIVKIAPRAVYTTGKGSSGVGLTAAVMRDTITGEMVLEGGALVLADNGLCCIDEFDKMEDSDRTAIHEVMEQQTVSIAKAGITTTLNARTTVIAAANPAFGRYNLNRSPSENLDMPAALLSRFDLLFVMLDRPDERMDEELAHHVTFVHANNVAPLVQGQQHIYSSELLRAYIAVAKQFNPTVSEAASNVITSHYVELRQSTSAQDTQYRTKSRDEREDVNDRSRFCTARMLLSTIRISQAVARVHFSDIVTEQHAQIAIDLMYATQEQLEQDSQSRLHQASARRIDPISRIYEAITAIRRNINSNEVPFDIIKSHVTRLGLDESQLDKAIDIYAEAGVWALARQKGTILFLQ